MDTTDEDGVCRRTFLETPSKFYVYRVVGVRVGCTKYLEFTTRRLRKKGESRPIVVLEEGEGLPSFATERKFYWADHFGYSGGSLKALRAPGEITNEQLGSRKVREAMRVLRAGTRYISHMPRRLPSNGCVIVHNFVHAQTEDQPPGLRGSESGHSRSTTSRESSSARVVGRGFPTIECPVGTTPSRRASLEKRLRPE